MPSQVKTFRVFVSSTFSDLKAERDALQERVFPRLRKLCMGNGVRFQAIDLRWGVSQEASLDQKTMNICLNEIRRCQKVTPRPNFIILLGDRYGWCPPPPQIPATEFEAIMGLTSVEEQQLLVTWYRRDENAVPPEYVLQPRKRGGDYEDFTVWSGVEKQLQSILSRAAQKLDYDLEILQKYMASATHQEIAAGALQVQDAEDHVFCFFRSIENLPDDVSAGDWVDLDDEGRPLQVAKTSLVQLKNQLDDYLGDNVFRYQADWNESGCTTVHLDQLCEDVYRSLAGVIENELSGMKSIDPLQEEIDSHTAFGEERARYFVGRDNILAKIQSYVGGTDLHPMAIWGESGSGKTAMMARAIQQTLAVHPEAVVISRFIGATPDSSNIRALLESLCREISLHYENGNTNLPTEYRELVSEFRNTLSLAEQEKPLYIFMDALDQLSDEAHARNLIWLPAELSKHARLVVTSLPGECKQVIDVKLPRKNVLELKPMQRSTGERILEVWLQEKNRTLQVEQRKELLAKFEGCSLPLYLKLVFEEACNWKSYTNVQDIHLGSDIPGVLRDLFLYLSSESNHGKILVSRSMGYLSAARNGLTEDELIDVLSCDDVVIEDFIRRSPESPRLDRLPVVVWSRLYQDLEPYMMQVAADGTHVLNFYHRQVGEVVRQNYLDEPVKVERHRVLAEYFGSQELETDGEGGRVLNRRKLSEFLYHLAWGRIKKGYIKTSMDFDFLYAKVSLMGPNSMVQDLDLAFQTGLFDFDVRESSEAYAIKLVHDTLQLSSHILSVDPHQLATQLLGRIKKHPTNGVLSNLLVSAENWTGAPWFQPLTPSLPPPGGPLIRVLSGHSGEVMHVAISQNGKKAVSASLDHTLKVWDTESGALLNTLSGHQKGVQSVAINPDGRKAISASWDHSVKVWDLDTGMEIRTLLGHNERVLSVAITPDGRYAVTGDWNGVVKVWEIDTGKEVRSLPIHQGPIWCMAISQDGNTVLSGSEDRTIKYWKIENGRVLKTMTGHRDKVFSIAFIPHGTHAVSGSWDGTMMLWDLESGNKIATMELRGGNVWEVSVLSDGKYVACGLSNGTIQLWNLETRKKEKESYGHTNWVSAIAAYKNKEMVISGSFDHNLVMWDLTRKDPQIPNQKAYFGGAINQGNSRAYVLYFGGEVAIWDLPSMRKPFKKWMVYCNGMTALDPKGRFAYSRRSPSVIQIYDLSNRRGLCSLEASGGKVISIAVSPDRTSVALGTEEGHITVFEVEKLFLTTMQLQEWGKAKKLKWHSVGHQKRINEIVFTPDNKKIITASSDSSIKIWDTDTGKEIYKLSGHKDVVQSVDVTSDGKTLISGSFDQTVRVWKIETGAQEEILYGHTNRVYNVKISPNGKYVASSSSDKTLRLWELETGNKIMSFYEGGILNFMSFTSDGRKLLAGGDSKRLHILEIKGIDHDKLQR